MNSPFELDGPRIAPRSGKVRGLVVFLHGLGADGEDLISLAPHWATLLPDVAFVSPHAPFACDMAPYGRQWFSLQDRTPSVMLTGVEATTPILDAFLDSELALYGLSDDRLALVGFSQGTMMSLYLAPRRTKAIGAVVGYSGALVGAERLDRELRSKPPVLLVHGSADPVVPFAAMTMASMALKAAGLTVETLARPGLAHAIDEEGLAAGGRFLANMLA